MEPAVALLCWLAALSISLFVARRVLPRVCAVVAAVAAAAVTYGLSWFWRDTVGAWWTGEDTLLAGPETAFLSIWALVLLPVIRLRFDKGWVVEVWQDGLVAAAALGLSIDVSLVVPYVLGAGNLGRMSATTVSMAIMIVVFLAGLTLCLVASTGRFPWEYTAWFSGIATMGQASHPALQQLNIAASHGLVLIAGTVFTGYCLLRATSRRGAAAGLWVGVGILVPVAIVALNASLVRIGS